MITNYSQNEFLSVKTSDKLQLICEKCDNIFLVTKRTIINAKRVNQKIKARFCSKKCFDIYQSKKIDTICDNCGINIKKAINQYNKSKHHFCSQSCSGTYNNKHKTVGIRRSKLEKYIEIELIKLYPDLGIQFNKKDTINSELDIYIPSLQLAFELNGIFHYEPIFSQEKLNMIQNNDNRKFQACIEHSIELCTIDVSKLKYFKEYNSQKYLKIIVDIINDKLNF